MQILVGILLGYLFQISQSLILPILVHNLIDGSTVGVLYYRVKKTDML